MVLYLSPHRRPHAKWDSSTGVTVSGDTRDGVPFKSDAGIITYLGTIANEQGRHGIVDPADVRAFLGVNWSDEDIHARISRVAHCTFEMPEADKPCECTDDKCRGNRRQIRVSERSYVCRVSGRSYVDFTLDFITEARSGAQLDVETVRHIARTPAAFSFVVAIILCDPQATATKLSVFSENGLSGRMQLPENKARARQSIGGFARHANDCQLGWSLEFNAREDVLSLVRVENSEATHNPKVLPQSASRSRGSDGGPPGVHDAQDSPGAAERPAAPTGHSAHAVDRRTPEERRADLDRWLSAALIGEIEPRPRKQAATVPPWAAPPPVVGEQTPPPRAAGELTPPPRAAGEPTPPPASTPTDAEIAAAASMRAMIGLACAIGFMPAMRGPVRGPSTGASHAPDQARGNSPPRPPPPDVITEIDGLKFVNGVLVEAPWLNPRRATPSEPSEAPAQSNSARVTAESEPPPGDEPDTS